MIPLRAASRQPHRRQVRQQHASSASERTVPSDYTPSTLGPVHLPFPTPRSTPAVTPMGSPTQQDNNPRLRNDADSSSSSLDTPSADESDPHSLVSSEQMHFALFESSDFEDQSYVPSESVDEVSEEFESDEEPQAPTTTQDWFLRIPGDWRERQEQREIKRTDASAQMRRQHRSAAMSVEDMNEQLQNPDLTSLERARFALEGHVPTSRNIATVDYVCNGTPYSSQDIAVHLDIDSYLWVGRNLSLPVVDGQNVVYVHNPDHRLWSKIPFNDVFLPFTMFEDYVMMRRMNQQERGSHQFQMMTCQKIMVAELGVNGMLKVLVCFPKLRDRIRGVWQDYPAGPILTRFYEEFLIPCLHEVGEQRNIGLHRSIAPTLQSTYIQQTRAEGHMLTDRHGLRSEDLKRILALLDERIHEHPDPLLPFRGAFLHIYSKNTKDATRCSLATLGTHHGFHPWVRFIEHASVLDWHGAIEAPGCHSFCDLGLEFGSKRLMQDTVPFCHFWLTEKLSDLFSASHMAHIKMDKEHYSTQIGGCRGRVHMRTRAHGQSPVIKMSAYHTMKQLYSMHATRVGPTNLSLEALLHDEKRSLAQIQALSSQLVSGSRMDHPSRLEYRIETQSIPSGHELLPLLEHFLEFKPFIRIPSSLYLNYLNRKTDALMQVVQAARRCLQAEIQLEEQALFLIAGVVHVFRSMFHRPDDRSWDRTIQE